MNLLFLCTGNSCRSIFGQATFNHLAPAGWRAMSAGSKPTGKVHPRSLALLASEGISTEGYYSKSWENLSTAPDIVITVCARVRLEKLARPTSAQCCEPTGAWKTRRMPRARLKKLMRRS